MIKEEFVVKYIPKHNGYRKIVTYKENSELKKFHTKAKNVLDKKIIPSKFAKAYIKKRSIISNANVHRYNDIFIALDIKDFFANIKHKKLIDLLQFELARNGRGVYKKDCIKIVKSCSNTDRGLLVGLKLSPILANIYLKEFDNILYGKLKKMNLPDVKYTRYADDLVISFKNCEANLHDIISLIQKLLKRYGLRINEKKTRIINFNVSNHVRITGINIVKDEKNFRTLSVGRQRKNELYYLAKEILDGQLNDTVKIRKVKGLQSFILSVEGVNYQKTYSYAMINEFTRRGYIDLKDFIDKLDYK